MKNRESTDPGLPSTSAATSVWRVAAVKAVSGLALGLVTALILVALSQTFLPGITDAGVDAGIRLKVKLDRLGYMPEGIPLIERGSEHKATLEGSAGFIFLDLDPEHMSLDPQQTAAPLTACDALARKFPDRYSVVRAGDENISRREKSERLQLHCESGRALNRFVLAQVISELESRGAKVIVLDIVLADGDVPGDEAKAMTDALSAKSGVPIVYAAPIQSVWIEDEGADRPLMSLEPGSPASGPGISLVPGQRRTIATVAIPEPGQPVRRYAKCIDVVGLSGMPTLPAAVASIASSPQAEIPCVRTPAPRIVYTVPPMNTHQDDSPSVRQRADWAFYRRVFNRCLISNFWNSDSQCGIQARDKSLFKDKIVVIGASNPVRRDWHYTPLGNMVGAQVIVNAVRSFVQFPDVHDKGPGDAMLSKVSIIVVCSVVWFLFHLVRIRTSPGLDGTPGTVAGLARSALVAIGFITTLCAVLAITVWMSFRSYGPAPSLDIVLGVLAISLEQFVELAHLVVQKVETVVARWFSLSSHSA